MQQSNQAAAVDHRLLEPEDCILLTGTGTGATIHHSGVLRVAISLPNGRDRDCNEQGVHGAGQKGEHGGVVEGVDVVEGEVEGEREGGRGGGRGRSLQRGCFLFGRGMVNMGRGREGLWRLPSMVKTRGWRGDEDC